MAIYKVRWKSEVLGEFSKEEIQANLRLAKFTFFHQVFVGDSWLKIKDFLDNYQEDSQPAELKTKQYSLNFAYFSVGLAFLSPYLIIISLVFSLYLAFKEKSKKNAIIIAVLSILMMILGMAFFSIVSTLKG